MRTDKILYGSAYYLEYMPYNRVDEDFKLMKKAGMNVIRIGESTWSTWEPKEGRFDFSLLDAMLDASEKYELDVIIGTPTYAIPDWLTVKYPDILADTHDGPGRYGHRQNMDITHPGYRDHCEKIIRAMLEHIKDRKTIIGYQLDNETKSYDTCGERVQKRFAEYLKQKFGNLDALNLEFGLNYWSNRITDWDHLPDVRGTINASLNAEFRKFQRMLVTEFLWWQASIVREYATDDQFITQNFDYGWKDYSYGLQPEVNQYQAAKCMTVAGCDIYHLSQDKLTGAEIAMGGAIARSIKRDNYFVLETQSQGNITWLPYEGQLRLQAFSHFSSGANSVLYWNWHSIHNAIESYWKGVLSHDLTENATYLEACTIGQDLATHGNRLKNLKKNCKAAIILDNQSLVGLQEFSLETGTPNPGGFDYNDIFRMVFDACYRLNLECDVLHADDLMEHMLGSSLHPQSSVCSLLEKYELIITPAMYSAPAQLLYALKNYVAAGGHLLSTFKTGFSNEHLKIYHDKQPHLLHECFGMYYQQFTVPSNVMLSTDSNAEHFIELLIPDGCETWIGYDNKHYSKYAAATYHKYQKGDTCYLGCALNPQDMEALIKRYCNAIGLILPEVQFPIIVKSGVNENNKQLTYYFNYSDEEVSFVPYVSGTNVLTGKNNQAGKEIYLKEWDFIIIEQN